MTPDDGDRLKSCAHCGGEAEFGQVPHQPETENSGGVFVECLQCGATTRLVFPCVEDPRPILLEIWNRRAALASAPGAVPVALIADATLRAAGQPEPGR